MEIIYSFLPPIFGSQPHRKETPSKSSPWSCPYFCKESKYISLPLQGSLYGCVGCLVPVSGPCGRICRCGLFVVSLVFYSFYLSYPPPISWSPPAPSGRTLSVQGHFGVWESLISITLMHPFRAIEIAHRPLVVEEVDGGSISLRLFETWAVHRHDRSVCLLFCWCCCGCCSKMPSTIFSIDSCDRGVDRTGAGGLTVASPIVTTGTVAVSLPSVNECHRCCVSRRVSWLVFKEEIMLRSYARCFT